MEDTHPDPMVSFACARVLLAASDEGDVVTIAHAIEVARAVACPREVVEFLGNLGAARLASKGSPVKADPWTFTRIAAKPPLWTWVLDEDVVRRGTLALFPDSEEDYLSTLVADLRTAAKTIVSAACGGSRADMLMFWEKVGDEEHNPRSEMGLIRLASCVSEIGKA